jgi:hypothetical protein
MIAVLALIVWRFVFTGLRRRLLVREIAPQQQQRINFLEHGLQILDRCAAGNRFENGSDGGDPIDQNDRAKTYLRRIVALTGAMQTDDGYVLDVEKMQFHVRPRYVKRLRDTTDPECTFEETCFYPLHKGMPKAEEIATVLLQLKNNPALFDKWAAQSGAFRADGQAFRPKR